MGKLFFTFLTLGIQSFGGGSSTFLLIHQACMRNGWLSEEEFVRAWALAQIAPGINLVKLTVMIGFKLRRWAGVASAMAGLLLPSAAITVLMTAGFSAIQSQPVVRAIMKGVLPATIGLTLAMAVQMAQPIFTRAYSEGFSRLSAHILITIAAALLMAVNGVSPVTVLLGAGAVAMLLLAFVPLKPVQPEEGGSG